MEVGILGVIQLRQLGNEGQHVHRGRGGWVHATLAQLLSQLCRMNCTGRHRPFLVGGTCGMGEAIGHYESVDLLGRVTCEPVDDTRLEATLR